MHIDSLAARQALHRTSTDRMILAALGSGMTVPVLYYGTQIVAAPFLPGYSFMRQAASLLGSNLSTVPSIFNAGVICTGLATLVAVPGYFMALERVGGANRILALLTCLSLGGTAIGSLWAGYFPLPDPRHSGHPALLIAMIMLPFLMLTIFWHERGARPLKAYLIATIVLLITMMPIMAGITPLDTGSYSGLLQRIFALTVFPPIAVCAFVLAGRVRRLPSPD